MKSKALTVIQKEEGSALFCVLADRAEAELVSDAVFGAHQFGSLAVRKFVCLFNGTDAGRSIDLGGKTIGYVLFVAYVLLCKWRGLKIFKWPVEKLFRDCWSHIQLLCNSASYAVKCRSAHEWKTVWCIDARQ